MFCPKCGSQNNDGAAFCKECGAQFRKAGAQTVPQYQAAGGAVGGAATAVAKRSIGKKPLIIAAIAIVIIAISVAAWFVFGPKDCYVTSSYTMRISGGPTYTTTWTREDNGAVLKVDTSNSYTEKTTTTEYKELVDGITIPKDATGSYQMNSDGYVSSYEFTNKGNTYSCSYTYYSPGIIKTRVIDNSGSIQTTMFNEDGWAISNGVTFAKNSENHGADYTVNYAYEFSNDKKTVRVRGYSDSSSSSSDSEAGTINLDDHGNPVSAYDASGQQTNTWTWEKVTSAPKMVAAMARLKMM